MIAPRDTAVYKPKKFRYGSSSKPINKEEGRGVRKSNSSPSVKGWRDSNDYRAQYFERNHGIGGYGYICSQCWKPMFKKENIQVDHIIPPSRFAVEKKKKGQWVKTSAMARFLNRSFNCAAICPDCNRKKSNKIDSKIIHGYAMKSVEVAYGLTQFLLSIPFMATAFAMWGVRKMVLKGYGTFAGHKRKKR